MPCQTLVHLSCEYTLRHRDREESLSGFLDTGELWDLVGFWKLVFKIVVCWLAAR